MPNVTKFAKALFALHQAGLLKDDACKNAVKQFIRQATESKHFHSTTHFRSADASNSTVTVLQELL